jgi:peptidoglycan/LPS O-acetylase OafA/YrhL
VWLGKLATDGALPGRVVGAFLAACGAAALVAMEIAGFRNELWRPLIWGAPAAAVVMGGLCLEGSVFASRSLKALGDASYQVYLWHAPVTALVAHSLGTRQPWLFIPAAVVASLVAGLLCRAAIEKPLLALMRGRSREGLFTLATR